jgi:aminoglycoside phosphotransferase (APT) family kinase protein
VRAAISDLHWMVDTDAVTSAWDDALRIPEWMGSPMWIHGDLAPGNVLLKDGRLSAVIDFSGVGVGDPSDDLRIAWSLLPANMSDVFRAALRVVTRPGREAVHEPWPRRSSSSRTTGRRTRGSQPTHGT